MRKLGSYLIILLLLTAYGRCVADQFGILHTTEASCCQVTCNESDHCEDTTDKHSDDSDHSEDSEEPAPCPLCVILSSDSMLLQDALELPSPSFLDLDSPFTFHSIWGTTSEDILGRRIDCFAPSLHLSDRPDPPAEQRSRLQRIVAKTTPVRGPSIT